MGDVIAGVIPDNCPGPHSARAWRDLDVGHSAWMSRCGHKLRKRLRARVTVSTKRNLTAVVVCLDQTTGGWIWGGATDRRIGAGSTADHDRIGRVVGAQPHLVREV